MQTRAIRFDDEKLLGPAQAVAAFFARVAIAPPAIERVSLDDAFARVLAQPVDADDDYPNAARSAMDGFALAHRQTPGVFEITGDVAMGGAPDATLERGCAMRIATGGVMPAGADAVVPVEDVRFEGTRAVVTEPLGPNANVVARGADMRRGERVLEARRRIGAPQIGVLATLGVTSVPVYRRPVVGVLSSGDELVSPAARPAPGEIRDSNRYAIAAALRAMGAQPRHYPTVRDEAGELDAMLAAALAECDAVAVTGGSSVGERDRLPPALAALGDPGIVVHGLRVKPGKPALFGAVGGKPILGLPGNPASALLVLEAVAAPIVAALAGAVRIAPSVHARLAEPVRSRLGWTWYVPVAIEDDAGTLAAHPLPLQSFSVSLTARADGYLVMGERDEQWHRGEFVTVHSFFGGL